MLLRSSRANFQIIWSSTLFRQVPYTHMELDLGNWLFFYSNSKKMERNPLDVMVVFYGSNSLLILGAYRDIQILK